MIAAIALSILIYLRIFEFFGLTVLLKMNALRRSKSWLSFILLITVLGHFGLGHRDSLTFVLCFGADGHVAVERIERNHDFNVNKSTHPKIETEAYFPDSDSPCTDIPIGEDDHITYISLTDLSKTSIDVGYLPFFTLIFLFILHASVLIQRRIFFEPTFIDPRLLALNSTVLLI